MRLRTLAIVAVVVLAYFAAQHHVGLTALRAPSALIQQLRNPPLRFALTTEPEPPSYDNSTTLKVHVIDSAGKPADKLTVDVYLSMSGADHEIRQVTLRGRGNGDYEGRINFDMAGAWNVDITAIKDGIKSEQRISIEVYPPPASPSTGDDDDT